MRLGPEVPLRVLLLWHMHQPDYRTPEGDALPWVRLHALADYYDMARLVEEAPAPVRVTVNLTPVLLSQLADLAARGPRDPLHRLCRLPVHRLGPDDRRLLLSQLFSVNVERCIHPSPAWVRLHRMAAPHLAAGTVPAWPDQDWIDLEVLFHLAWSGRTLREDPFVAGLLDRREGGYREAERDRLLDLQDHFLPGVIPLYRRLWETGRIEVSTTPLHHPILPLLHDTAAAWEADPQAAIQGVTFRWPEDAHEQVVRGRALVQERMGRAPAGLWPSEGSLSDPVVRMLDGLGIAWTAGDRQVLDRSLEAAGVHVGPSPHLRPWRLHGTGGPVLFFRDTDLSDRIGFSYARWSADDAVADLLARARALAMADPGATCLPIVLDGENAWESYKDRGIPFLSTLYRALGEAPDLEASTFSEAAEALVPEPLPRLQAGSWIDARFATWIGHPEKTRAWMLLQEARRAWDDQARAGADPAALAAAREHLLKAEGSDWFWWLGDDHPSPSKGVFEALFRHALRAAWAALGRAPPQALDRPIFDSVGPSRLRATQPTALVHPRIDGLVEAFYEWTGAGAWEARTGAMARAAPLVTRVDFGFDPGHLYLRAWLAGDPASARLAGVGLWIHLEGPAGARVLAAEPEGRLAVGGAPAGRWAAARVFEAAVELAPLGLAAGDPVRFHLEIRLPDEPPERIPPDGDLECAVPGPEFDLLHWSV